MLHHLVNHPQLPVAHRLKRVGNKCLVPGEELAVLKHSAANDIAHVQYLHGHVVFCHLVQSDRSLSEGCDGVFENLRVLLKASHEVLNVKGLLFGEEDPMVFDGGDHHVDVGPFAHLNTAHPSHHHDKVIKDKVSVVAQRLVLDLRRGPKSHKRELNIKKI